MTSSAPRCAAFAQDEAIAIVQDASLSFAQDEATVTAQLSRQPRTPWRVGTRCALGYPTVIVSPSLLDDGARFPNLAYLTCPYLVERVSQFESSGATALFAKELRSDKAAARELHALNDRVKAARAAECKRCGQSEDVCASVGLAGQRDPLGVKCLHIHVAYELLGLDDAVGARVLAWCDEQGGRLCV